MKKRQPIDTNSEMLELSDKDFKADIMKMLQQTIINTPETNFKSRQPWQRNRKPPQCNRQYKEETK